REDIVDWNKRENAEIWRHAWEEKVNEYLEKNNRPERIYMRSYERQGIDLVPTVHLGPAASEMERRGEETILGTLNRDIVKFNSVRKHLRKALEELKEWIEEIKKIISELKEEKEPTIADILIDYLNSRQEAHNGKSKYYYSKDLAVDLKQVSQIVAFLQERNITTADSLWKMIEEVSTIQSRIDTADERIKELKKGIKFLGDYSKYKTVADEYTKRKFGRDKFKTEHSKELNSFYRAKRWVDENPKATTRSMKAELEKLQKEKDTEVTFIESNYGSLEELKRAKFIISKVLANVKYQKQEQSREIIKPTKIHNQNIE
ncbi:MAG: MobA/MobL family protein, partial [Clostridia bacterium]|nr:MobA/MobL family protein [Clostridia bacterium]